MARPTDSMRRLRHNRRPWSPPQSQSAPLEPPPPSPASSQSPDRSARLAPRGAEPRAILHRPSPAPPGRGMGTSCSRHEPRPRSALLRLVDALMLAPHARKPPSSSSAVRHRRSASPPQSATSVSTHTPPRAGPSTRRRPRPLHDAPMDKYVASAAVADYAAVSTQNSAFRKRMEDECVAIPRFRAFQGDAAHSAFFGVYDGHGGDFCSKFAAQHFHQRLAARLADHHGARRFEAACSGSSSNSADTSSSSLDICADAADTGRSEYDSLSSQDVARCYAEAFAELDAELEQFDESAASGSTAVACLIRRLHGRTSVHVANVGDSRAVLFADGRTTRLSVDHKATNEDEVRRIRALNGIIFNKRVAGSISVTRALGQADEKRFITSAPHVASVEVDPLNSRDAFLLLVSDGVSDVFSDEQLTAFVRERLETQHSALAACTQLLDEAKQRGSMDNMTAVLVRFGDAPPAAANASKAASS